jgi:hypothetical protein
VALVLFSAILLIPIFMPSLTLCEEMRMRFFCWHAGVPLRLYRQKPNREPLRIQAEAA